ncbi:FtsX-like permease family protein [Roseimaritima sediminicola]|uniref:FtsX-like permease family protein n=1 Tax=Roseimaritima sediminicola TaxID=2662066 RepID=UPI00129852B5|nr:FtsX-like permease family protein [Roseimaritima sediminicola]
MNRTPLAWKNLTHQPARTIVSIGGIAFAVLLMFMQLGFLGAVGDTANNVYQRLDSDLVLRSPEYLHVYDPRSIPRDVLRQVAVLDEVASVKPLDLGMSSWQNPHNHEFRVVAVIGVDIHNNPLRLPEVESQLPLLMHPDHVLIDRTSSADLGPVDGRRFGAADVGRTTTALGQTVRIVGTFAMGTGLAANGQILTSRDGFLEISPTAEPDRVSMLLVRTPQGVTAQRARRSIQTALAARGDEAASIDVLTVQEAMQAERRRWYQETPIGIIFAMGVALAVIVGGVICYMVLAADVLAHLPEYATLKAIGYSNGFLGRVLLVQAGLLALFALPPALLAALALYEVTSYFAGVPIRMTGLRIALIACLSILMCSAAGIIALRKLSKAEPANLF